MFGVLAIEEPLDWLLQDLLELGKLAVRDDVASLVSLDRALAAADSHAELSLRKSQFAPGLGDPLADSCGVLGPQVRSARLDSFDLPVHELTLPSRRVSASPAGHAGPAVH